MRCGGQREASKCPFVGSERYKCQKKGHIARAYRSSQSKTNEEEEKGKTLGRRTNRVVDSPDRRGIGCSIGDIIETGDCKGIMAKIHLNPNVQPKFVEPRPIPHGVKGTVGDNLDRLERNGILERIAHSDWAAPVVPVMKPHGAVRICGDVKVTENPQIKVNQYPLPGSKESFAWRKGSQQFTKLDSSETMNKEPPEQAEEQRSVQAS